ncbi:WS/DGAT domain-containing protein [Streptomyces sp. NPDC008001]|uniref:WS/DGAT domain-containing protein n=1 Tax=Streptomyces sp. NPDC008001 TaxID=3364804 RepID=UPI0036EDB10A
MAADHGPEAARGDFWARGWAAYERRHPSDSLVIGEVLLCSGIPPTREDLRRMVTAVGAMVPVSAGAGPGPAEDPDRYFHEASAGAGKGEQSLRAVLSLLAVAPLPPAGADMWLVRGHEPGAFALVLRAHHLVADGVGASGIVSRVAGDLSGAGTPSAEVRPPEPERDAGRPPGGPAELLGGVRAVLLLTDFVLGVPPAAPVAPVPHRARTGAPRHMWAYARAAQLRRAGAAFGASVNDVYLACLAGALRAWYGERGGRPRGAVMAVMPVTIRAAEEGLSAGNRFVGARVRLPVGEPDPVRRLAAVAARTSTARRWASRAEAEALLRRCPEALASWVLRRSIHPRLCSLLATSVPGPPGGLRMSGWRVDHVVPLSFLPAGHAVAAVHMDYGGEVCVSFTADRSLPEAGDLPGLWLAALREVCAAAGLAR